MTPFAEEIKKQDIIDQLTWDDSVNANNIHVNVTDPTVELRGTVQNYTAKMAAERDAYHVAGVMDVKNYLEIEKEIWKAFERTYLIDADKISVDVRNGTVHLKGSVPNFFTKIQANNIAIYTTGVKDVVDDLTIG